MAEIFKFSTIEQKRVLKLELQKMSQDKITELVDIHSLAHNREHCKKVKIEIEVTGPKKVHFFSVFR